MNWLLLTLGAALLWGFGNFLLKKGLNNITPVWNNLITDWIMLILWIPAALILSNFSIKSITPSVFAAITVAAITLLTYYYALSKGKLALTGTVLATYPVATIILSFIFLNERVSITQYIGIFIILISCILIAFPEEEAEKELEKDRKIHDYSWLIWGLTSATLIGAGDFFMKISINAIGSYSHMFYLAIIMNLLTPINYVIDKKGRRAPKFSLNSLFPTLIGSAILLSGTLLFFLALEAQKATLVAPVSSVYIAIMVILAILFLKEKINRMQTAGIIGVILGIILTGVG